MKIEEVISLVMTELNRAEEAHPDWPKDDVRAAAVVAEESGELVKAVLDHEEKNTSCTQLSLKLCRLPPLRFAS